MQTSWYVDMTHQTCTASPPTDFGPPQRSSVLSPHSDGWSNSLFLPLDKYHPVQKNTPKEKLYSFQQSILCLTPKDSPLEFYDLLSTKLVMYPLPPTSRLSVHDCMPAIIVLHHTKLDTRTSETIKNISEIVMVFHNKNLKPLNILHLILLRPWSVNPNKRFLTLVLTISYHVNAPITQFINPDLTSEERRELLRQEEHTHCRIHKSWPNLTEKKRTSEIGRKESREKTGELWITFFVV